MANAKKSSGGNLDMATIAGLVLAVAGIVGGLLLEGGEFSDILQFTAAMIVLGGTLGAVMISTPPSTLIGALSGIVSVLRDASPPLLDSLDRIVAFATQARKNGLVSLEDSVETLDDPFLKKALMLAVDGSDLQEIRDMLSLEIEIEESRADAQAKVFEAAGGYAPTIGIIGAVMGLIQVMKNLANIDEVGHGIAVAFVATVYGVGLANLILLPAAAKIKARARSEARRKELISEGVAGIVEGLNPKLLRLKLEPYVADAPSSGKGRKKPAGQPEPAIDEA